MGSAGPGPRYWEGKRQGGKEGQVERDLNGQEGRGPVVANACPWGEKTRARMELGDGLEAALWGGSGQRG